MLILCTLSTIVFHSYSKIITLPENENKEDFEFFIGK